MDDRINEELNLLRKYFPNLSYNNGWILIPEFNLPGELAWNKKSIQVSFQFPVGYPGTKPYGIYVPSDLTYENKAPLNFKSKADNSPPFEGNWGILSWSPEKWDPKAKITEGSNIVNFVHSFIDRFRDGR